ncbi:MAG: diguanylate cyclase [Spirochaetes bacterium]|nr:diguanylate cyclase [Spirochaetota bacterium]
MPKVLIVEDSKVVGSVIKKKIESGLHYSVHWVQSYLQAKELLDKDGLDFFICLVGLYLPDAPAGEIVDYVISKNLPTIVFTGELSDEIRKKIWSKKVVDYVVKESGYNLDYVINLIKRIYKNKSIKVLVVDDSQVFCARVAGLLAVHQYQVFQAGDGIQALKILNGNPDIKLVITDYNMPNMDGFQFIKEIRAKFSKEDLSIIGMSGDNLLSAKFIKLSANDFISKDFFTEEFYCRITQNIEAIEHIREIKEASNRDYLTDLHNRRYFYDVGQKLFENAKRNNITISVAMIDIDYFKKINDSYGHDKGDLVLQKVARIIQNRFRASDIVSRIGGEEFCVLACNMGSENVKSIFEQLRKTIEESEIISGTETIKITISTGICLEPAETLDEMIKYADKMLYKAKEAGRNRVEI